MPKYTVTASWDVDAADSEVAINAVENAVASQVGASDLIDSDAVLSDHDDSGEYDSDIERRAEVSDTETDPAVLAKRPNHWD